MDNESLNFGGSLNDYASFLNSDNFLSNDAFLTSIGINPSSTYSFPNYNSPSNAQILEDINASPGLLGYFNKLLGTNLNSSDLSKLAVGAGGIAGLMGAASGKTTPTGYQGKIPNLVASRQMVTAPVSSAVVGGKTVPIRPGAGGTKYGGDVVYTNAQKPVIQAAEGKYLRGPTDGMADELPAQIGKNQPAALSHGEFVVPADVVSHLGNGNSDAGAKKLYQMMDKVRQARTGNKKQGKKINPDKYMPGGIVGLASGGEVKHFAEGGTTAPTSAALAAGLTGTESNLSNWVGPYVTDMLGKGQALSNMPYEQYSGQLTAGASPLQSKVFQGLGSLNFPGNLGQSFASPMRSQQPYPVQIPGTGGGMPPPGGFPGYDPYASSLVQQNDPFYQSPEYKQFQSETEGGLRTADMYDSPNFGSIGSGTIGRAMDEAYGKYKAGLPASRAPRTEDDWNRHSSMAMYAPGTDMAKAKADFMSGGGQFGGNKSAMPPMGDYTGTAPTGISGLTPPQTSQQPSNIAQSYMNPYLQNVLTPQLDELQRRSQINLQPDLAKLTQAGGFGGGRQAIMQSEANRNLLQQQNKTVGEGYASAYDKAMQQFNTEQGQAKDLANMMSTQGGIERGITAEGIAADKTAFEEARTNPYKMVQFQQSLLQGLPLAAQSYNTSTPSALVSGAQGATTIAGLLKNLGLT